MDSKQVRKILKATVPILIVTLAIYFFTMALSRNWEQIKDISLRPNGFSVIGILFLIASVLSSGLLWGKILNKLDSERHINRRDAIRIHCASWLLKYIPGQTGSYLNKLSWGGKKGYSKKALTNSFIYENALLIFASILITVPVLLVAIGNKFSDNSSLFLPLLLTLPLLLVLNKNVFYRVVNAVFQKMRKQTISKDLFLSTKQISILQLEFIIPRVLNGAGFVFIAASLLPVEPSMYIPLGATYVLAGIVGVLAIFVPSGIGVREAVIVLFASAYFTPAEAVLISVASRFYATVADIGVLGIYVLLNKGKIAQQ